MADPAVPLASDTASAACVRRPSATFEDAIHDLSHTTAPAPAQLYSTESGRLFHSGRIVILTVGLPARGKTHISVSLARYLRWLGVKTRVFHLGDYRRAAVKYGEEIPDDYFFVNASSQATNLRQKIMDNCRDDIYHFLDSERGQIAIFDAVNPLASSRRALAADFAEHNIETLFIESLCDDEQLIEANVRKVKIGSPDYIGWDQTNAVKDYLARIAARIPHFETMQGRDLNYIKVINAGERIEINNCSFGYLHHRIVFYLMNLQIKSHHIYFVRAGTTEKDGGSEKADPPLGLKGQEYAGKMTDRLIEHRKEQRQAMLEQGDTSEPPGLVVWTSTKRWATETGNVLRNKGYKVRHRTQLRKMSAGACENMPDAEIKELYPEELAKYQLDPYHHRYPRGESYHDLAVRLEPIILELERASDDVLIVAHESVLKVLYGYLMACHSADIPFLSLPRNEILQVTPESYRNKTTRIHIPGVPAEIETSSPQSANLPVIPSEAVSPEPVPNCQSPPIDRT